MTVGLSFSLLALLLLALRLPLNGNIGLSKETLLPPPSRCRFIVILSLLLVSIIRHPLLSLATRFNLSISSLKNPNPSYSNSPLELTMPLCFVDPAPFMPRGF
ncbi:hypothetical protein HU200_058308 [Digitaria exilis]|uniref:Secreted protein n=1 Tax=Digitaria exilis TaxID=1010633 RepID=A0A835AFT1_9POAL|nr:hypothetical protein HU200_058308 [Digitaria exilis]